MPDGAAFCPNCGAAPGNGAVPAARGGPGRKVSMIAALCYVLGCITGLLFLLWNPYRHDRFVRFHAYQSIAYTVSYLVFWYLYSRIALILLFTSGPLWTLLSLMGTMISLAAFLFWLFLMYKAYHHEKYMIPFLGALAARHAG
jgi:uncharacterized membrane protein